MHFKTHLCIFNALNMNINPNICIEYAYLGCFNAYSMHILIFNMHIQCIINAYAPFSTLWISHFQWTYANQNYILEPSKGKVHSGNKIPKLIKKISS